MKGIPGTAFLLIVFITATALLAQSPQASAPAQTNSSAQNQASQATQSDTGPIPTLKAKTRLVIVDVVATDSKGDPVTDLRGKDFTVLENGKPQDVRIFNFQHPDNFQHSNTEAPVLAPPPANVFTNVPHYQHTSAFNVIILDGLNTGFVHSADMRRNMLDFLHKLSRDEPVAIYGLNERLELLQDFTTAGQAVEVVERSSAGGTFSANMFRSVPESEAKIASFMPNMQHLPGCLRTQITVRSLNWIVNSLVGLPGRKNLIWISEDFPFGIYTELSQYPNGCFVNESKEIQQTVEQMLDREIAVYPIVAEGLENHDFDAGGSIDDQGLAAGPRFAGRTASSSQVRATRITLINDLAHKTGGEAFHDRNDLDMDIRKSIDNGSTYYTLGYYPSNKKWDGNFRTIDVKVNRDGIHLRYRLGYFANENGPVVQHDDKARGQAMNVALTPEVPAATSLLFEATFVPPSRAVGNKALVKFAIDPRGISFEHATDNLEHASVDCVVKVYSPKGAQITTASSTMNAKLKPETYKKVMQSSYPCQQSLALEPGNYLLRLGVIDNRTGLLGTTSGKVTVD